MEAMTAASVAALTIYDMCKSVNKGIVIRDLKLEAKDGGNLDCGQQKYKMLMMPTASRKQSHVKSSIEYSTKLS